MKTPIPLMRNTALVKVTVRYYLDRMLNKCASISLQFSNNDGPLLVRFKPYALQSWVQHPTEYIWTNGFTLHSWPALEEHVEKVIAEKL